ncbi:hypothetical protein Dsin_032705, partial [Dipteronia sinensis]
MATTRYTIFRSHVRSSQRFLYVKHQRMIILRTKPSRSCCGQVFILNGQSGARIADQPIVTLTA